MSNRLRGSVKWDSSTDEDTSDAKYGMKLRESSSRSMQPSSVGDDAVVEPRRRGRGPSKRPCLNRNALMARENRQRKKAYLEKIENKLSFYQQENKSLASTIRKQGIDIKRLSSEVAYLRSVLNNNTSITALLKTINEGLRRIGAQKRNSVRPKNGEQLYTDNGGALDKCDCYSDVKENGLDPRNIFVNTTGDQSMEGIVPQGQINGFYTGCRKQASSKSLNGKKVVPLFSETDHTYTIAKSSIGVKKEPETKELENVVTTTNSSASQGSEDSYTDNLNGFDGAMPIAQLETSGTEEKKDLDIMNMDFDQLPSFNMDIFEDLPKCDDIMNTVDSLHDASALFSEEDMFHSLDNSGICLHVNPDKVSLEFCSICHLNSKNSGVN